MATLPPGPRRLFGKSLARRDFLERPLSYITEMAHRYGDLVCFRAWRNPIFFVNHPKMIREVLISRKEDFARADGIRKTLRAFEGDSVLVREGDDWQQQRRFLQKGFRPQYLRGYAGKAVKHTREMLKAWPSSGTILAGDEMERLCTKTLASILFGVQPPPEISQSIRVVLDARAAEAGKAVFSGNRFRSTVNMEVEQALNRVNGFLDELIKLRRREEEREDLLGVLIQTSQSADNGEVSLVNIDRGIRDDMMSMIAASSYALAAAMSWTLYLVAQHDEVQTRLRQEAGRLVDGREDMPADIDELPFAEKVIQESLRLYPPNWALIPRRCVRESTVGGYRIPKGSLLYIFPYVVHRDARWFANPECFDPDRFLSENFGAEQRSAYIPLGLGPHVCIGRALSTIVLTSILARILQEFRLTLPSAHFGIDPEVRVVMRPANGLPIIANRNNLD